LPLARAHALAWLDELKKQKVDQFNSLFCWDSIIQTKDSEAVLGVWLLAPLPTPRALPDHGALWPLAVGVEKDLGDIDV